MPKPFQLGLALALEGDISEAVELMKAEVSSLAAIVAANSNSSSEQTNTAATESNTPRTTSDRSESAPDPQEPEPVEIDAPGSFPHGAVSDLETSKRSGLGGNSGVHNDPPGSPVLEAAGSTWPVKPSQLTVTTSVVSPSTSDLRRVPPPTADEPDARSREDHFAPVDTHVVGRSAVTTANLVSDISPKPGPAQPSERPQTPPDFGAVASRTTMPLPPRLFETASDQAFPETIDDWRGLAAESSLLLTNVASAPSGGSSAPQSINASRFPIGITNEGSGSLGGRRVAWPTPDRALEAAAVDFANVPTGRKLEAADGSDLEDKQEAFGREGRNPLPVQKRPASQRAADAEADKQGGHEVYGDVFLDGALLGRWITRLLNKEAGRASVGPTGYDIRRGRLLPGPSGGI